MNDSEELVLEQYGDKELWFITGEIPEGQWSIPMWVNRYKSGNSEFVRVTPIAVLPHQMEKLDKILRGKSIWNKGNSFILEDGDFTRVANKAKGVTPEFYRKWPGIEAGVPQSQQTQVVTWKEPDPPNTQFLKYLSERRGISYNLIKMVWWGICEEAPFWMVGERKPIDLGFVVLYPFPFRPNWKEVMLSKHPNASPIFEMNKSERDTNLLKCGFLADLCSGHNISMNMDDHTINWTIEAVPQKAWEDECHRMELIRLSTGKQAYTSIYERIIKNLLPSAIEAMGSYFEKIVKPFACVRNSSTLGGRYLVPTRGNLMRKKTAINQHLSNMLKPKNITFGNYGNEVHVSGEIKEVSPLHPVLQEPQNLWGPEGGHTLEEPSGTGGTIGLPVLHANESKTSGKPVLPKSNG